MSTEKNDSETPKPYPPIQGEKPGKGIVASDETIRRLQQQKSTILPGPKGTTNAA